MISGRDPGLLEADRPAAVTKDDLRPSGESLDPNLFNRPAPKGFKMEPGPASAIRQLPMFKCPNQGCSWATRRESLVERHRRICDSERQKFVEAEKQRGVQADEVRQIVVDTVKPMFESFAGEIRELLKGALPTPPPAEKPRSKKHGSAPARKGAPRGV